MKNIDTIEVSESEIASISDAEATKEYKKLLK